MPGKNKNFNSYLEKLKERGGESKAYTKHQLVGLEIAALLDDFSHKSLYIKLAKELGADRMLEMAKDVATRANIKNKGAYFMRIVHDTHKNSKSQITNPK
ncbi:MAG: hypothetical protein HYT12_02505 [Candidatus Liptonbacteria bacterium]|nr:hypothetical protein [Candidatus Liptonbacteria bacterium]